VRRRGIIGEATLAVGLLAVGAALAPAIAPAQTVGEIPYLEAVDAWADAQDLRRLLPGGGAGASEPFKPSKRARRPTARQLRALRFVRTDEVRRRNYQAVMDRLEPGYDPAVVVAEFDRVLDGVHGSMRASDVPMSPDNIADVAAYTLLNAYAAYYDRKRMGDPGVRAVRDAARHNLALDRRARRLSDADTQELAEMLELRTILRISDLYWGRQDADAAREQAAINELNSWIDDLFGVEVERVRFSRKGLVPR
jgi:hypothetical protein